MRTLINTLAIISAALAIMFTLNLYFGLFGDGFSDGRGMAIVVLQIWALIGSAGAVLFGFIGRRLDRTLPRPARRLPNLCIAAGLLCGLLIFATPFVFG